MFTAATGLPAAPPIDFPVAEGALRVALFAAALVLGLSVVWAVRNWRVSGSPLHLLCLAGGLVCSFDEAIVDILGKCWFPPEAIAYTAYGRDVPWWVVCCYGIFFGNLPYLFARAFQKGITKRFFWQCIAGGFAFNALIEMPVLSADVYTYYGNQPFSVGGFPLWWMFVNTGGAAVGRSPHLALRPSADPAPPRPVGRRPPGDRPDLPGLERDRRPPAPHDAQHRGVARRDDRRRRRHGRALPRCLPPDDGSGLQRWRRPGAGLDGVGEPVGVRVGVTPGAGHHERSR